MNNQIQRNTRFAWTQALHDVYQTAVDGLNGPKATTVNAIMAAIPEGEMELFGLSKKHLKQVLQSYLQRDRAPNDATVQERRARYAQGAPRAREAPSRARGNPEARVAPPGAATQASPSSSSRKKRRVAVHDVPGAAAPAAAAPAAAPPVAAAAEGDPGAAAPAAAAPAAAPPVAAAAEGDPVTAAAPAAAAPPVTAAAEGDPVAVAAEGDPGAAAPEGPSAIPSARTAAVAANGDAPPAVHAPTPAEGEPAAVSTVAPVLAAIAAVTLHVAPAKVFDHGLNAVLSWVARPETFEVLLPLGA